MADMMVKIKVPLPPDDPSSGEAEWMWADADGENRLLPNQIVDPMITLAAVRTLWEAAK
jgi:hypothetical protein